MSEKFESFETIDDLKARMIGNDPAMQSYYDHAVARLEFDRKWGWLVRLTVAIASVIVVTALCTFIGAGGLSAN